MNTHEKAAILGSFVADTFALGAHWIYDTREIEKKWGVLKDLADPMSPYHPNRKKGQFTHYGDQMLFLLRYLHTQGSPDETSLRNAWADFMKSYGGYMDGATKTTLKQMSEKLAQPASSSSDLAGASRLAPILLLRENGSTKLDDLAELQTTITHQSAIATQSARFLAQWLEGILEGNKPSEVLQDLFAKMDEDDILKPLIKKALDTTDKRTTSGVKRLGQACSADGALPASIYIVLQHENDFRQAMIENVNAGGDSSARGMAIGLLLGAYQGIDAIPAEWLNGMEAYTEIVSLLD